MDKKHNKQQAPRGFDSLDDLLESQNMEVKEEIKESEEKAKPVQETKEIRFPVDVTFTVLKLARLWVNHKRVGAPEIVTSENSMWLIRFDMQSGSIRIEVRLNAASVDRLEGMKRTLSTKRNEVALAANSMPQEVATELQRIEREMQEKGYGGQTKYSQQLANVLKVKENAKAELAMIDSRIAEIDAEILSIPSRIADIEIPLIEVVNQAPSWAVVKSPNYRGN